MLDILFLILKIIGLILVLILLILVLILALPGVYSFHGQFKEDKKATFKFHTLLYLLTGRVFYVDGKAGYIVRLLGMPIIKGTILEQEETKLKGDKEAKSNEARGNEVKRNEVKNNEVKSNEVKSNEKNLNRQKDSSEADWSEKSKSSELSESLESSNSSAEQKEDSQKKDWQDKVRSIADRLVDVLKTALDKLKTAFDLSKKIKGKIADARKLYRSKGFKRALIFSKETLFKLYMHIKPDKLSASLVFGFDSPDKTGKVLALLSVLYGTVKIDSETFSITPDFEKKILDGEAYIKGKFVLGYIILLALRLYFRREVQFVIKQAKRIVAS